MRASIRITLPALALAAAALSPRPAQACGGTFCDRGPTIMSVDQTGENIIFVMEPGQIEAHIQIQYRGDAAHFSWVLPVSALPEVEAGSQALFDRLLAATVPRFGFTRQTDICGNRMGAGGAAGFPTGGGVVDASAATADSGVSVVLQTTVGSFDVTVLSGGTTAEVLAWLDTNGYQTPPNAAPLFEDYVARNYLFVAVKLTGGAGTDQIHPLVIRYAGTKPCVPLKLTAVAATEDMGVRTFFLGTRRVVPRNFKHVVPNPILLDWNAAGGNYNNLVGRAADSPVANGKAFVTEYAGPTAVVGSSPIASPAWNPSVFLSAQAVDVINLLRAQGLVFCSGSFCSYSHPLILPLLREFLPAPATLAGAVDGSVSRGDGGFVPASTAIENTFYSCLSCYASSIDTMRWDATAFASAFSSRIVEPARHADALLASWPYLTRMFTTISPAEMTEDPEFLEHDGLGDVRISGTAVRRTACTGASGMILPDGRQVALTPQGVWPGFSSMMPFAERIEEIPVSGAPLVLVNNTERINAQLKAWNDSQGWPPAATGGAGGGSSSLDAGAPSTGDAAGAPSTGGAGGAGGGASGAGGASHGAGGLGGRVVTGSGGSHLPGIGVGGSSSHSVGCACRAGSSSSPASPFALAVTALATTLAARRRRRA